MLAKLFGGYTAEKILMFMFVYGEGYARQINRLFNVAFDPVNKQLAKFEDAGILVSRMKGRTKLYTWNPRYPFLKELQGLLSKALNTPLLKKNKCITVKEQDPEKVTNRYEQN
jgi:hypothetical protein